MYEYEPVTKAERSCEFYKAGECRTSGRFGRRGGNDIKKKLKEKARDSVDLINPANDRN